MLNAQAIQMMHPAEPDWAQVNDEVLQELVRERAQEILVEPSSPLWQQQP
jgi:hypothetical protein